ncbi:MAG: hypothetical protein R3E77_02515 [Steroidobacteraceae bacterium]
MSASAFTRLWLPGFLLQSVIVGGGYATGRELVEFFLSAGPLGGLLGMVVAAGLLSLLSALAFEYARMTGSQNYRRFFVNLLGRGWWLYEIAYLVLMLLVLAVIAAATSEIAAGQWHLPPVLGTALLLVPVALLVFRGSAVIEKVLAAWSFVLYAVYAILVLAYLWKSGGRVVEPFEHWPGDGAWLIKGISYFGYNLAVIPLVLFCVSHMQSRRDAFVAGALAGPLVMIPALMFYMAMVASYPEILQSPVPADFLMQRLDIGWLSFAFYVVVFGTFIETGTAMIHALNDRVAATIADRGWTMPGWLRPTIAIGAMLLASFLALRYGIIALIARGYGALTWAFILIFALPLATRGVWQMRRSSVEQQP